MADNQSPDNDYQPIQMDVGPPLAPEPAPNAYPLYNDLPCVTCGYNLRGLDPHGQCPECGALISRSLEGNFLRNTDPEWPRRLASGAMWMAVAMIVGFVLNCVGSGLSQMAAPSGAGGAEALSVLLQIVSEGLAFIGIYLATTPQPHTSAPEGETARLLARWPRLVGLVCTLAGGVTMLAQPIAGVALAAIGAIATVVSFFATFVHFRNLARRIPSDRLERQTSNVMTLFILAIAAAILAALGFFVLGATGGGDLAPIGLLCVCGMAAAFIVGTIWWLVLLFMYRAEFEAAARIAEINRGEYDYMP